MIHADLKEIAGLQQHCSSFGCLVHQELKGNLFVESFPPLWKMLTASDQSLDYETSLVHTRRWRNCTYFWIFALLKQD